MRLDRLVASLHSPRHKTTRTLALTLALLAQWGCGPTPTQLTPGLSLSCQTGLSFSEADLGRPPTDPASDDAGKALASFLASPEITIARLPRSSWFRAAASDDRILFLGSRVPDVPYAMVAMRLSDHQWAAESWGGCWPRFQTDAAEAIDWNLEARPAPAVEGIDALVSLENCGGTDKQSLLAPTVTYGVDAITVTIWATRPSAHDAVNGCLPGLSQKVHVPFSEAIGTRTVRDGGVSPARVATVAPVGVDPGNASPGPDPRTLP